jgi:FtsH-binding integral membrane protein
MAETQHDHRLGLERDSINANISAQKLGTILGFVIAMTAILGGVFLAYVGKETSGLVSIITALVGLAGVFVYGKYEQKKDLAAKTKALTTSR